MKWKIRKESNTSSLFAIGYNTLWKETEGNTFHSVSHAALKKIMFISNVVIGLLLIVSEKKIDYFNYTR